jgi:outer membrane beta-barrel protein
MESRVRLLLLSAVLAAQGLAGCSLLPWSDRRAPEPVTGADAGEAPVIDPVVERREIKPADIDSEDFQIGAWIGQINVEDFGSTSIYGFRGTYNISPAFFLDATYGQSGNVDRTSAEVLNNIDLLGGDRQYKYYDLSLGWNVLPGEIFLGRKRAMNSALYLVAGAGNTTFGGDDFFTLTYGGGFRVLPVDFIAVNLDVRNHMFDFDRTGTDKSTNNLEYSLGFSWFF